MSTTHDSNLKIPTTKDSNLKLPTTHDSDCKIYQQPMIVTLKYTYNP